MVFPRLDLQSANSFEQKKSKLQYLRLYGLYAMAVVFVLAAFLLAYRPVMFNFLISDDFDQMVRVSGSLSSPELLFKTYWAPWLGLQTHLTDFNSTVFYRPFFITLLFLGCKLWGANGLCFRLVNMTAELLSGLMLGLVVAALKMKVPGRSSMLNQQALTWGLFSAALFVLFPLHTGVVNWICVGMDPLIALFSLCSLWCYIQWRNNSRISFYVLSIISVIFALLTKEMAAVLPLTILVYELLCGKSAIEYRAATKSPSPAAKIQSAILATCPYWLILVLYFCFRKIVLGDFIAGYPDGMYHSSIEGWLKGLRDIFVPINTLVIGTHSYIFKMWHIVLLILVSLNVIALIRANRDDRKVMYFLAVWFVLTIAPTYKVFPELMNCVTGSRLAYLATAPVCALLTYGIATFSVGNRFSSLFRLSMVVVFGLAAALTYSNNLAWAEAGRWTNKVVQELKDCYRGVSGDPLVYVTGLPMISKKGIYSVFGLDGITKRPIMDRDIYHCMRLDFGQQYVNIGFVKEAVASKQKQINLLYWDSQSETLKPVMFMSSEHFVRQWQGKSLKEIIHVSSLSASTLPEVNWLSDGTLEITSHGKGIGFIALELQLPQLPCWNVDFLDLKAQFIDSNKFGPFSEAELRFRNDIAINVPKGCSKEYFVSDKCYVRVEPTNKTQEILFRLRNIPTWTMGGKCSSVRIVLPIKHRLKIEGILIPDSRKLIPYVYLQSLPYDMPGQIRLDKNYDNVQCVQYDAHLVRGCKQVVLEIVQASAFFETANSQEISKIVFLKKSNSGSSGQFIIKRIEFPPEKTVYRARLRALDESGNQTGFVSDEFFIRIDS